jgi:iron(III) transport system ATP-binding protein
VLAAISRMLRHRRHTVILPAYDDAMTTIILDDLGKSFDGVPAIQPTNLALQSGSFTALLGPSGCGKTTLLRLIAGFERPSTGTIQLGHRLVAGPHVSVPPERRSLGIVFQSYALWPHMDVAANVAYPLLARGVAKAEIAMRVARALAMVSLTGLGSRSVDALSGGQRQRVALARCLVTGTDIILLDEPLANLDVHLRAEMLDVFARLHRDTGATIVFVTHDQAEALALADRIVVLDRGTVQQSGAPEQIYAEPANAMVAGFVGRGVIVRGLYSDGQVTFAGQAVPTRGQAGSATPMLLLRPEHLTLAETGIAATIATTRYTGAAYDATARLASGESLLLSTPQRMAPGARVHLAVSDAWIVPG